MQTVLALANNVSSLDNNPLIEERVIEQALSYLEQRLKRHPVEIKNPTSVSSFLRLLLGSELREVFAVLFLDSQHRLIACEKLFYGSINSGAVYPRIVLQRALEHNAAAVILAHNHPSGHVTPSVSDKKLTTLLIKMLRYVEIRVLDHIIVTLNEAMSFVCSGLLKSS